MTYKHFLQYVESNRVKPGTFSMQQVSPSKTVSSYRRNRARTYHDQGRCQSWANHSVRHGQTKRRERRVDANPAQLALN